MLWPSKSRPGGSGLGSRLDLGPVAGAGVAAGDVRGVGVGSGPITGVGMTLTEAPFGIPFGIAKVITPPFQALLQFLRILQVLRGEVPKHWRCPLL